MPMRVRLMVLLLTVVFLTAMARGVATNPESVVLWFPLAVALIACLVVLGLTDAI